jgi:AcrR family transcriptional regulator
VSESSTHGAGPKQRDRSRPRAVPAGGRRSADGSSTSERIIDAALVSFATRGYEASSLDALAQGLEIRKQTILYWFPSKEVLLEAVIDRSAIELSSALEASLASAGTGWSRVEAVVRSVFRLGARRPELLGLVREMGRLGTPAATRLVVALDPLVRRASEFLEAEMDAGHMKRHEPRLLLLAIYSTVTGMLTEVEVLRAFGEEPTARSLVRRRNEILELLRSALLTDGG